MAIYLVQHGISSPKDVDPQKGLSDKGKEQTELIGKVAKGYNVGVEKIVHSGKERASQTATILKQILNLPTTPSSIAGIGPLDDVQGFGDTLHPDSNLMIIGHLPFLQKLVSYLATGSADSCIYKFQNSGIVCMDCEKDDAGKLNWYIKWTLNPNIS